MIANSRSIKRARNSLDRRLDTWHQVDRARPNGGWIRAIREALGMSASDLADRMGIAQSTVTRAEASERSARIQVDTLDRFANAMECDLVYALVPRRPLDELVHQQATAIAKQRIDRLGHTMALEAQDLEEADLQEVLAELADRIKVSRGLWRATVPNGPTGLSRGTD